MFIQQFSKFSLAFHQKKHKKLPRPHLNIYIFSPFFFSPKHFIILNRKRKRKIIKEEQSFIHKFYIFRHQDSRIFRMQCSQKKNIFSIASWCVCAFYIIWWCGAMLCCLSISRLGLGVEQTHERWNINEEKKCAMYEIKKIEIVEHVCELLCCVTYISLFIECVFLS